MRGEKKQSRVHFAFLFFFQLFFIALLPSTFRVPIGFSDEVPFYDEVKPDPEVDSNPNDEEEDIETLVNTKTLDASPKERQRSKFELASKKLFTTENSCTRHFVYRNETLPLDNCHQQDAIGLDPIFKNNSQAMGLLLEYRQKRDLSSIPAYTGSIGLISILFGNAFAGRVTKDPDQRKYYRYVFTFGGIGIILASYAWSNAQKFFAESKLDDAVSEWNRTAKLSDNLKLKKD